MATLTEGESRFILAHICEPGDSRINQIAIGKEWGELIEQPKFLPNIYQSKLRELNQTQILKDFEHAKFTWPSHANWPLQLDDLNFRRPLGIWYQGAIEQINPISIAIVGARSASNYGEQISADIAMKLAALNIDVVSGGAFGIDAAAHYGALQGDGFTIAVMAGGVDVHYPKTNSRLFERICETGLIISEVPPGTLPIRHRFLIRNRIIAALSTATLVVEARIKSGAMSTAGEATQIGRDVMAIPGSIHSASSAGCHQLIRDGAILVTDVKDICELILGDYPQYST